MTNLTSPRTSASKAKNRIKRSTKKRLMVTPIRLLNIQSHRPISWQGDRTAKIQRKLELIELLSAYLENLRAQLAEDMEGNALWMRSVGL